MTKFELLKDYVEGCIEDMNGDVNWARDRMQDDDRAYRYKWALHAIDKEDHEAYGALSYAHIWEKDIDEDQYKELAEMLHNAWCCARDRAANEIMMAGI